MKNNNQPCFGVAGFPLTFFKSEYKKRRENIFQWLKDINLDWIELQNTYGVKMKDEQASIYRDLAVTNNIGISLHAPYYITLASSKEDVVERSKERIIECFNLAAKIGSKRIIFHPGHFPGSSEKDRELALEKIISGLNSIKNDIPANDIFLYPETAGKRSQIGSIDDIICICAHVEFTRPCIDVAHVHGFNRGTLTNTESIVEIFNLIEEKLGYRTLSDSHFHMYPVEIDGNGEKKHKAFHDRIDCPQFTLFQQDIYDRYYPLAEHFIAAIKIKKINPVIICEARDSQDSGALLMKTLYFQK